MSAVTLKGVYRKFDDSLLLLTGSYLFLQRADCLVLSGQLTFQSLLSQKILKKVRIKVHVHTEPPILTQMLSSLMHLVSTQYKLECTDYLVDFVSMCSDAHLNK